MRDIVFVHVPKTAGTSLRASLIKAFPDKQILYDYGRAEQLTSDQIRRIRYNEKNEPIRLRDEVGSAPLLLVGHFPAQDYLSLFAYENFITFVRNPVDRVVSDYKHFVRHFSFDKGIVEFAALSAQRNRQAKFLRGLDLDHVGFIGISEDYDESLLKLSEFLGRPIENIRSNEAPKEQAIELSASERQEIEELNSEDIILYNKVLNRESIKEKGVAVRGSATRIAEDTIRGWAVPSNERRIATISLEIDGILIRQDDILCDIYRPDLIQAGINATGLGGFEVNLSQCQIRENPNIRLFSHSWEITI